MQCYLNATAPLHTSLSQELLSERNSPRRRCLDNTYVGGVALRASWIGAGDIQFLLSDVIIFVPHLICYNS